jgi:DNA-binding NtrC family response regulator
MPAIKERPEDIPVLAEHFLNSFAKEFNKPAKQLSVEAVETLRHYEWPGNVRELRNAIERLVILESDPVILPKHLPLEIHATVKRDGKWVLELPANGVKLIDVERQLVLQAMERAGNNQTHAAELLGIERDALRRRLLKYGFLDAAHSHGVATAETC